MPACGDQIVTWQLSKRDQEPVIWDVAGLPIGATASLQVEGAGPWRPMEISDDHRQVSILVAGSEHPSPVANLVLTETVHCEIRIVAGTLSKTLDGGYIQLIP